jgi:hypothetical protein
VIECLIGQANGLYSGLPTTVINGQPVGHTGDLVYLQGNGFEGVVYLPGSFGPPLAHDVLSTVIPTGKPC